MLHNKRFYRLYSSSGRWNTYNVKLHTSDLYIRALNDISVKAGQILSEAREEIENHIKVNPEFLTSLEPVTEHGNSGEIVSAMYKASKAAGTGPMAAVAGAVAEYTGKKLVPFSNEIIVENGGDIWMNIKNPVTIGIYCNNLYFKDRLAIKISETGNPCSVCTSSSGVGHSISFGKADSATIVAKNGALADAVATETCNRVKSQSHIEEALNFALSVAGVQGCLIVMGDKMAAGGDIELTTPIDNSR
jgi:ApbE superfamily uncharacterized protein (UPF0280 family)